MDRSKLSHLPMNPEPIRKGDSPQYDEYLPYEIAIVKFDDDLFPICNL